MTTKYWRTKIRFRKGGYNKQNKDPCSLQLIWELMKAVDEMKGPFFPGFRRGLCFCLEISIYIFKKCTPVKLSVKKLYTYQVVSEKIPKSNTYNIQTHEPLLIHKINTSTSQQKENWIERGYIVRWEEMNRRW
jgi:hypothetical protein